MSNGNSLTTDHLGALNKATNFTGTNSFRRFNFNIGPDALPAATLSVWARFTPGVVNPLSDVYAIVSHDDGPNDRELAIDYRSGSFGWSAFGGTGNPVIGGAPYTAGQWTMLTAVYDNVAGTAALYVNGTQITQVSGSFLTPGVNFFLLGMNPNFPDIPFPGDLDDMLVFNKALSPAEVQLLYQTTAIP